MNCFQAARTTKPVANYFRLNFHALPGCSFIARLTSSPVFPPFVTLSRPRNFPGEVDVLFRALKLGQLLDYSRCLGSSQTACSLGLTPLVLILAILLLATMSGYGGGPLNSAVASRTAAGSSSASVGSTGAVNPAPSASNAPAVSLLTFGNAGFGGDDTSVFQNALNNTAANGQALGIPAGSYNISPIFFPNNSQLVLDAGVTVTANPGFGPLDKMLNITSQNVSIQGAGAASVIFQMRNCYFTNTGGTAPEAGIDIEPNSPNNTVADVHITNNYSTGNAGAGLLISLEELNGSSPTWV